MVAKLEGSKPAEHCQYAAPSRSQSYNSQSIQVALHIPGVQGETQAHR